MSQERSESARIAFGGIVDRAIPGRGGYAQWHWNHADLNRAATLLLTHVDRILEQFSDRDCVWFVTLELDLEEGRFPEAFASFFRAPSWNQATRFYVPEILKASSETSSEVGVLVCELRAGLLKQLLSVNDGFRWGSALRIAGVQAPADQVELVLKGSLFDPEHASRAEKVAKCVWAASADLNALALWVASRDQTSQKRVEALGGSLTPLDFDTHQTPIE